MPPRIFRLKHSFLLIFSLFLLLAFSHTLLLAQDSIEQLRQGFLSPPDDAKVMMRWWWYGPSVVKPELAKELETMRGAGIGGVEIQPVYPLVLDNQIKGVTNFPYLSPEFLSDVSYANQKARELGLRVSMTLGSGWPYGGPKTTVALSAGRLKVISVAVHNSTAPTPALADGDTLIAAFLISGTEKSFDPSTATQFDPAAALPANAENQTALYFISSHTGQMVKRAAFGAEGLVLDHFSRAAIDEHLTDVAAPLLQAFGSQPPDSVFSDSLEVYSSDWTSDLPAQFKKLRGYDLIPHLPQLLAGGTPEANAVRHDWGETLSDLVRTNYLGPLTQFARAHHTQFRSQTYGTPAVTLADEAVANLPEGEGPQWRAFSYTRWASSASHLYNRNVTSAETWTWLHSPAFRATPLDMKAEADRMFLLGINQFVGHGYPYSPPEVGEPGWAFYAAAVFNAHNPWFPVMPDVMRYLQRVSWMLRQGKPANDIAILLPEDDAQAAFTPGHVSVTDEMRQRISPALMSTILDTGYNIDYIDAATIDKLQAIPYSILIIPPTTRIPLPAYEKIASYAAKNAVIAIGHAPSLAPGLMEQSESAQVAALSGKLFRADGHKGVFLNSLNELPDALHKALPADVDAAGQTAGLGFIHRKLADSDIYFVANTGNQTIDTQIKFRTDRPFVETLDADSGRTLLSQSIAGGKSIPVSLAPYESRIFIFSNRKNPANEVAAQTRPMHDEQLADLRSGWQIQFTGAPAAQPLDRLTSWTEIPGKQNYSGEAAYTRTVKLDNTPQKSEQIILDFGKGTLTTDNRPLYANGLHALLDPPIREAATVYVNGQRAGTLWHPPYRIDITTLVHAGNNRIEVRVYNTAINLLAGQPPHDYSALDAKYGKRFEPQDMENLKQIPSGLLGPIRLLREAPE